MKLSARLLVLLLLKVCSAEIALRIDGSTQALNTTMQGTPFISETEGTYSGGGSTATIMPTEKVETSTGSVITSSSKTLTCEDNPCDQSVSFCKEVNGEVQCLCKPGYLSSSESCKPGLLFAGILFIESITRALIEPSKDDLQDFLQSAYSGDEGFKSVEVADQNTTTKKWNYDLVYDTGSGANQESISGWFSEYLENQTNCDSNDSCEIEVSSGDSFLLNVSASVRNSGISNDAVCASVNGYCDVESSTCQNINGYATCQCLHGYVEKAGGEGICTKAICLSNKDCNSPFGWCTPEANDNVGECKCLGGFSGTNCHNPWLFVFVIIVPVLVVALVALGVVSFLSRQKAKKNAVTPIIPLFPESSRKQETRKASTSTSGQSEV